MWLRDLGGMMRLNIGSMLGKGHLGEIYDGGDEYHYDGEHAIMLICFAYMMIVIMKSAHFKTMMKMMCTITIMVVLVVIMMMVMIMTI